MHEHAFLLVFDHFAGLSIELIFLFGNCSSLSFCDTEHRDGDWCLREERFLHIRLGRHFCPDLEQLSR